MADINTGVRRISRQLIGRNKVIDGRNPVRKRHIAEFNTRSFLPHRVVLGYTCCIHQHRVALDYNCNRVPLVKSQDS
ncbi:hypothetical protein Barb7_03078 [Bacteroidales bacterium Barb7]|nr:hypothetical protein Barb7_03078 [Bacteroidales bacterium Barb7]